MKLVVSTLLITAFILFFSTASLAAPLLHSPQPTNNTFISGGVQTLSINITSSDLNSSSAILHIISLNAYERRENWDAYTLTCLNVLTEWGCNKNISFAIAGSDTVELFYFEANDNDGTGGNNGTAGNPLRFTLDRNPPVIDFISPGNNSYVSGNKTVSVTVTDASSGVNGSTLSYSTDNATWTMLKNASASLFGDGWNTSTFSNNQTVVLYAKATDNIGNSVTKSINVTVDNEMPQVSILSSLNGTLSGNVQIQINVNDSYSGIDLGNIRYSVGSLSGTLGCAGNNYSATCNSMLNTANLEDGNHVLNLTVTDRAGNFNSSTLQIKTGNTQPSITIIEPLNNGFIRGNVLIRAVTANAAGIINYVEVSVETGGNKTVRNMTCNSGFTSCNYSLDTSSFADGGYIIRSKAVNTLNSDISSGIAVTIDNTYPSVNITQPTTDLKGDFEIKVDVIDTNLNQNKVAFNLSSFNGSMSCTPQTPSRFICSTTFNSKQLTDGKYFLNVSATDKSGNIGTQSKKINIANQQTTSSGSSPNAAGSAAPESSTGETSQEKTAKEEKKIGTFTGIAMTFKNEYILLGVVVGAVVVTLAILAIVVSHRLGKTIIRED